MMKIDIEDISSVTWEDIGGYDVVKKSLQELTQLTEEHENFYKKYGMSASRRIMLYGARGCSQCMMGKAVANQQAAKFMHVRCSDLWLFDATEYNIREIFDKARSASPCVVFLDEFEAIGGTRSLQPDGDFKQDRMINQVMTELDGIGNKTDVIIIGSTDRPDTIDSPLIKPGCLDQLVFVPLPDETDRLNIIQKIMGKLCISTQDVINFVDLARKTEGFSVTDVAYLCNKVIQLAGLRSLHIGIEKQGEKQSVLKEDVAIDTGQGQITQADLLEVYQNSHSTVNQDNWKACVCFEQYISDRRGFGANLRFPDITSNQESHFEYDEDEDLYS